jgi:hypothetical protein
MKYVETHCASTTDSHVRLGQVGRGKDERKRKRKKYLRDTLMLSKTMLIEGHQRERNGTYKLKCRHETKIVRDRE